MSVIKLDHIPASGAEPFRFGRSGQSAETLPKAPEIKSGQAAATTPRPTTRRDEIAALNERIATLEKTLEDQASAAKESAAAAREEGRKAGLAEAESKEAERLQLLSNACVKAQDAAIAAIGEQNALSVEIARATIAQILGERSYACQMVTDAAELWRDRLGDSSLLKLTVSAKDFADEQSLSALQAAVGKVAIATDAEHPSGTCLFELRLGSLDASIPLQAVRADELLAKFGNRVQR